ncbi:MAG: ribonuclease P protein component [Hyphomicrobium sp.]|nr:ribonuclease P protein component [Hyphomicrobium sp.]
MSPLATLKVRAEYLAVRGGSKASVPACLIEARIRRSDTSKPPASPDPSYGPRFGFTVTKKLGNAVTRNRIRRRLKAALTQLAGTHAQDGYDYVVVARAAAFDRAYHDIIADLTKAFAIIHSRGPSKAVQRPKIHPGKTPP